MKAKLTTAAAVAAMIALAGCQGSFDDLVPKAERGLPDTVIATLKSQGMTRSSPIMVRIFKEENVLEIWKQKDTGRFGFVKSYEICKWSGKLGPKFKEGDRQAPEGFYTVRPAQMNPKSSYHLSFNMGYPNTFDRSRGRTGTHLMVHGACSSAGCYSMTDEQVEEIYAFARDSFRGGQTDFQIQAFPFRMTAANLARHRKSKHFAFWKMLKEGNDHFEITKVPPKIDVCDRRYIFNRLPVEGEEFQSTKSCPETAQPEKLTLAYQAKQRQFDTAFARAISELEGRSVPKAEPVEETPLTSETLVRPQTSIITGTTPDASTQSEATALVQQEMPPAQKKRWWKLFGKN